MGKYKERRVPDLRIESELIGNTIREAVCFFVHISF